MAYTPAVTPGKQHINISITTLPKLTAIKNFKEILI